MQEVTATAYIVLLSFVSVLFFFFIASFLETGMPYTDLVLTFIAVNFVMSKLFTVKTNSEKEG